MYIVGGESKEKLQLNELWSFDLSNLGYSKYVTDK
jgi:hypothetical protein